MQQKGWVLPLPTSTAYLALDLDPNIPIKSILPEFKNEGNISHLLNHTLDYRFPMSALKDLSPQEIVEKIYNHKFEIPPGQIHSYANANSIILGFILEKIYGMPLRTLAKQKVFEPLNMKDTDWHAKDWASKERIIPSEICEWRGYELRGETHDESAWKLEQEFGAVGSAGIFSTAPDILNFLEHAMTVKNWSIPFEKTGFTGTYFIFDPKKKICLTILSNYTYPHRKPSKDGIEVFRQRFWGLLNTFESVKVFN